MQLCSALTRSGFRCRQWPLPGKRRCKLHGGRNPGGSRPGQDTRPAKVGQLRKVELLHALGLRWYGGRPRKLEKVLSMVDEAREHLSAEIVGFEEAVGRDVMTLPLGELSPPEVFGRAALLGLYRLVEILETPITEETDLKTRRLQGDMALGVNKQFARIAAGNQRNDALAQLLAAINARREEKSG